MAGQRQYDTDPEPRPSLNPPDLVVNLTDRILTPIEKRVLNLGLGFVPTPSVDLFSLNCELQKNFRKIKLQVFFADKPNTTETNTGLRPPSTFSPPNSELPPEVLTFERSVLSDVSKINQSNFFQNLSRNERNTLQALGNDPTLVIKPADKGGGIVLLTPDMYRTECLRLLSDSDSYLPLRNDPTKRLQTSIKSMVCEAEAMGWILPLEADFLVNKQPKIPYFYTLPKIHKNIFPPPGRPIVSGIDSLLEPLSKFVDVFLRPIVTNTSTYLRDTKDILQLIDSINDNTEVQMIITLDVESLYTSIPQQATLEVVDVMMREASWDSRTPPHFVLECATIALTENFFLFEDQLYLQTKGTSMGSTFAPSLACLYMYSFERRHILGNSNPYKTNIVCWRRYIDDIIVIWQGDNALIPAFTDWVNTLDPFLNFSSTASDVDLPFLDLLITIKDGKINTRTYEKPTDKNSLLKFESHHPRALRNNLPYGQFLRIRRNCTDHENYRLQSTGLSTKLEERGYPRHIVREARKRASNTPREVLLTANTRDTKSPLTCVTSFTPISNQIRGIIQKRWNILNSVSLKLELPLFSFKRTQNCRDILVHTRPRKIQSTRSASTFLPTVTGHYPCTKCAACKLTKSSKFIDLPDGTRWRQTTHTNCNTSMCIYLITCPCGLLYVGMTTRQVKIRILEHRSTIRCGRVTTKMTQHFADMKHPPDVFSWTVLETQGTQKRLFEREQRWVFRLNTSISGLNDAIPWSSISHA